MKLVYRFRGLPKYEVKEYVTYEELNAYLKNDFIEILSVSGLHADD